MSREGDVARPDHQPALDGVRGVAVTLVLLFHGGFAWMSGGYVGVSVFFTLSGFLITGLLLREHTSSGALSLRRFYARRVRRLLPASLLCLVAVSVAAAFGAYDGVPHVRRDILAALFQVANWNALASGSSYADLVARTTGQLGPVDHFWSLSVEEQFYWVWPVLMAFLLRRAITVRSRRVALLVVAAVSVALAPVIAAVWGANAAYWATPARLGEILVGAALAAVGIGHVWRGRWLPWLGAGGLAVVVVAAVTWPADRGPAYSGWLGVFALASAALIAGLQVESPLRQLFSVRPLVHLGRISYGVYLYHWPVFALLSPRRTGLHGWGSFTLQVAVTLAIAQLSYVVLEQPIRHGVRPAGVVARRSIAAVGAVAVLAVLTVPADDAGVPATFAPPTTSTTVAGASTTDVGGSTTPSASDRPGPSTTTTTVPPPQRVLVVGDSTAEFVAGGLHDWAATQRPPIGVASLAQPGCGFVRDSRMFGDGDGHFGRDCDRLLDTELPATLASQQPDVVVAMVTLPDVLERTWNDQEGPLRPADERYRERLQADTDAAVVRFLAAGVDRVVWVIGPPPSERAVQNFVYTIGDADWAAYVGTIEAIARLHPGHVEVVRLDEWMAANEPNDGSMRPDGVHLPPRAARQVADAVVGPAVLAAGAAG